MGFPRDLISSTDYQPEKMHKVKGLFHPDRGQRSRQVTLLSLLTITEGICSVPNYAAAIRGMRSQYIKKTPCLTKPQLALVAEQAQERHS